MLTAVLVAAAALVLSVAYVRTTRRAPAPDLVARIGTIESDRLVLRAPVPADADGLAATVDDEVTVVNGWPPSHAHGRSDALRSGASLLNDWVITDRVTGAVLGLLSVRPDRPGPSTCELGWWVGPAARGEGRATEAVGAAIAALHAHGYTCVRIGTAHDNVAIQRILDKVGAVRVADTDHELPNGEVIVSRWYEHRA